MRGAGSRKVALLADSEQELKHFMLRRLLRRAALSEQEFYLGLADENGLIEDLQRHQVKVVVPLGEQALGEVLGEWDIARWRGRVVEHPHLPGVWVVPTLQPSKLLSRHGEENSFEPDILRRHPPRFHGIWMRDVHHALDVAKNGFSRLEVEYLLDPTPERFAQFAEEFFAAVAADPDGVWLSWDIETPYKQKNSDNEEDLEEKENVFDGVILRISFSFRPGYAVSVPWNDSYLPTILRLLGTLSITVGWNGRTFDIPTVENLGYEVKGVFWEGMDAYKLLQSDLPKGIEWVSSEASDLLPWKHRASAEPAFYSCVDADAGLRNMLWLRQQLTQSGQWPLFINHVVRLMPLLVAAGKRGNLIDIVKREEIRSKLIAMRDGFVQEIQQYVPRELFPRTEYKTQPEGVSGDFPVRAGWTEGSSQPVGITALDGWDVRYELGDAKFCTNCGTHVGNFAEHVKGGKKNNPCKAAGAKSEKRPAWLPRFDRLEPFNPNSSDQLKAYMRHFNHPIGVDKKDASKQTADAGHLKKLHKAYGAKFPLYSKTLVIHKVSKTIGTYTPEPDEHNRIHTMYVNSTSTWRLGSRKVPHGTQIQNWGKRKEEVPTQTEEEKAAMKLAYEARKQIIASPGCKLVQIDSSAVEAVMQGYYMNDIEYMKLASKSIHAWLCCRTLGWEFTPENVERIKKEHANLYSKMKVVNYLTNFGGGPKLMADTYPDEFPTKSAAQAAQDDLYRLLPSLKTYHHQVRWEAHTKTYLTTPWGYRHWYYDVFAPTWDDKLKFGKDAKRAVAMKPQNSNAAFQKDNLLLTGVSPLEGEPITDLGELDRHWGALKRDIDAGRTWAQFFPTNVSVHDSLCLDCPIPLVEKATKDLLTIFTRPIPQMNGLRIGAEVEVGENWADMERVAKIVIDSYDWSQTEAGRKAA